MDQSLKKIKKIDQIDLAINNVKISCKIRLIQDDNISFNTDNCFVKYYSNFCVIKSKFTFIIFTKKKEQDYNFHANITKISNFYYVSEAVSKLSDIVKEKHVIEQVKIENLTCFYHVPQLINLRHVLNNYNDYNDSNVISLRYRPEKFPGMFISLKNCTVLLFSNGKLVVIGASNEQDAKNGILHVLKLVQSLSSS